MLFIQFLWSVFVRRVILINYRQNFIFSFSFIAQYCIDYLDNKDMAHLKIFNMLFQTLIIYFYLTYFLENSVSDKVLLLNSYNMKSLLEKRINLLKVTYFYTASNIG